MLDDPAVDDPVDVHHRHVDRALDAEVLDLLRYSLALTIGTEAMIAARDVSGLDEEQARAVVKWATEALVARAEQR